MLNTDGETRPTDAIPARRLAGLLLCTWGSEEDSVFFFFSSRRRHTRFDCDWSSDVCSSDLADAVASHDGNAAIGAVRLEVWVWVWLRLFDGGHLVLVFFPGSHVSLPTRRKEIGRASCRERV